MRAWSVISYRANKIITISTARQPKLSYMYVYKQKNIATRDGER